MRNHDIYVSFAMIEAIKNFPGEKEIEHCETAFTVSPFDFYAVCPVCQTKIKVRSVGAAAELEDVFEAVFEWLAKPEAKASFEKRQREILGDRI